MLESVWFKSVLFTSFAYLQFRESSCGQTREWIWLSSFLQVGCFSSLLVMIGAWVWKAVLRIGEVLSIHRLSENTFLLGTWHPGQGVVRVEQRAASYPGVFSSLVQDNCSGAQRCCTVQNCLVKGLVNYAQQPIPCGNWLWRLCCFPLL